MAARDRRSRPAGAGALLVLALAVPLAHAQPATAPVTATPAAASAPTAPTEGTAARPADARAAPSAAAAQGRQIATQGTAQGAAACVTCHGARGEGSAAFPRLAGAGSAYLRAQLEAFANGSRANPIMQPIAKALSPEERAAVAQYYHGLPAPVVAAAQRHDGGASPDDAGAWLASRGRWADNVPACAQCHGPAGQGVGEHFPPLAGLPAAYITEQLQAWRAGKRPPGPLQLMQAVASRLTDADITAVSQHYAALGSAAAGGGAATPAGAAATAGPPATLSATPAPGGRP